MPSVNPFNATELLRFRANLDIPSFVEAAVRYNLNREEVLIYLHVLTNNSIDETEKMWQFVPIAKQEELTRSEILVWLHISYGGLLDPKHLSEKLRFLPDAAKQALAVLREKGIITNGRVL